MNSKALIRETLKYLETNENGQPKYKFSIYRNGITQSVNRAVSMLTGGLVNNTVKQDDNEPVPVSVYTIGDIFDTIQDTGNDIMTTITELPSTLEHIKVSLKQLGYSALDNLIETLKNAILPIEVVQTLNDVYRVAKPLVEKVRDIATIMFYYPSAAKVAQDVLEYLSRLAVSTAKNYLSKLFDIFLDTPVFAIYENDETVNLSGAYSFLSDTADNEIKDIALSEDTFDEIMRYANSESDKKMYEPSYSNLGITIADTNINDVFHDLETRKIFIASDHKIFRLNEDYSTTKIIETEHAIEKIYYYNDDIYYIANDNGIHNVYREGSSTPIKQNLINPKIIYSNPIYLCDDAGIYDPSTGAQITGLTADGIKYTSYDYDRDTLYYVREISGNYHLFKVTKSEEGEFFKEELSELSHDVCDIAYFNDMLYIVKQRNGNGEYYITKVSAGVNFEGTEYSFPEGKKKNIIYTDGSLATDGSYVYKQVAEMLSGPKKTKSSINCVIQQEYEGSDFYVASGGNKLYVSHVYDNGATWYGKQLLFQNRDDKELVSDSISGCLYYHNVEDYIFAYSQKNIYLITQDHFDELFDPPEPETEYPPMICKEFAEFKDWWDDREQTAALEYINISDKKDLGDCILTSAKVIGNNMYIALYNPKYNSSSSSTAMKTGVYRVTIRRSANSYTIQIPKTVAFKSINNSKIYSFNRINNIWYYTDGLNLYNVSTGSVTNLESELDSDRALTIVANSDKPRLFTSKMVLDVEPIQSYGELNSLAKYYNSTSLHIASTRNALMISDNNYVYNIVDNGEDGIDSELYQICYEKGSNEFDLIQSCDAAFITSLNSIKKVPFYDILTSSEYGCGYYTDTTPNKWYGAAPYYFASNVLNSNKNSLRRNIFIGSFSENFKVELEKLLKHIPDAFIDYTKDELVERLRNAANEAGVEIEGDDGQIKELLIESVASNTSTSLGMYIHDRFMELIGNDDTYQTFAISVYERCIKDETNNMTKDFYDIFKELYFKTVEEAVMEEDIPSISDYLLRYYQTHKGEWAKSMTDLIDVDIVEPNIYERYLKDSEDREFKEKTYRFNYETGLYEFKYLPSIKKEYEVIEGYFYDNDFYSDEQHQDVIDHRTTDSDKTYYAINGEDICYKDPEDGQYYKNKINNYTLTEDVTPESDKTYYKLTNAVKGYQLTADQTPIDGKTYYEALYIPTEDAVVNINTKYYSKSGGDEYRLKTEGTLPPNEVYYEKQLIKPTEDTSIVSGKTYYNIEFEKVTGSVSSGPQYYKLKYVKTYDTIIDPDKFYYELIDSDSYTDYYEYDPSSSEQKYSLVFTQAPTDSVLELNKSIAYYVQDGNNYKVAKKLDIENGPFYYISGAVEDTQGEYVKKTFGAEPEFGQVTYPTVDNLPEYYELDYVKIKTPDYIVTESDNIFVESLAEVLDPISSDLNTYYEPDNQYVTAIDLDYAPNGDVINNRNLYEIIHHPEVYTQISDPSGNPAENKWYEVAYVAIEEGDTTNPQADGLYEFNYTPESFTPQTTTTPKADGLYEYACFYSEPYDDMKVYVNLSPLTISTTFPAEDLAWHNTFYNDAIAAGQNVSTKSQAYAVLDDLAFPYPSWEWEEYIKEAVTELYIPQQGEQYKEIVRESNMYPIQWHELPSGISRRAFDYALTTLLYMIKQRLISNITLLVDGGEVKCYSCIDASDVIRKIVNRNYTIWKNQIRIAKENVRKANTVAEIREAFNMVKAYESTLSLLEKALNQQSALYAKYIDMLINEQIINDNDTEVVL